MRVRSLAGRLLILQLTVVAVTVAAGALVTVLVARERTQTAARERALTIARTVAALPEVPAALRSSDPTARLQPLAERVRAVSKVDFVVVMSPAGIRYTHPDPARIGKRFVGTIDAAARGGTVTETTRGTLGRSMRAVVPVREGGRVVALVGVGVLTAAIGHEVASLLPALLGLAAVVLLLGCVLSLLLARRLKRQTLGLEPQEIATLYAHHDATLHALREGVVVFDDAGRPALVNDHAQRLLGDDLEPLRPLVASGEPRDDAPLIAGDRVLLASVRAVRHGGRRIGTVLTLRDRTEVEALARELGAVRALADALRAQTHEAANRLHVIAGLVELGRTEEAIALAGSEAQSAQDLLGRLGEGIEEPVLVALLLGKTATARERGADLRVAPGARLREGFPATALATIVGNLVDNALEAGVATITIALADDGETAELEVRDDGPGLAPELLERAFEAGVTTKGAEDRGLGLALVRRAVTALGGTVAARNEGGAVITARLPHARDAGAAGEGATRGGAGGEIAAGGGAAPRRGGAR
jgi:two-component system CitB family sensor kinase